MDHYWNQLPPETDGLKWFAGVDIYASQVARAKDGAVFVELGAWKGRSTVFMAVEILNSGKQITFHSVDHWQGSDELAHLNDADVGQGRLYEAFLKNIEPVKQFVHPMRCDSAGAAASFADESVDFVYVDAGHTFEAVSRDLLAWWPKIKPGGVLAGDDWQFKGVEAAVIHFARAVNLRIEIHRGNPNDWKQWQINKR